MSNKIKNVTTNDGLKDILIDRNGQTSAKIIIKDVKTKEGEDLEIILSKSILKLTNDIIDSQ